MGETILVVEDDAVLRETLVYRLNLEGYETIATHDGYKAVELALHDHPDLILLDIMLPGIDGFEVCRILRQHLTLPIIILTARTEELDRVVGLEIGADEYITKPFGVRELLARIRVQLRRVRLLNGAAPELPPAAPDPLRFGDLEIDFNRCEVTRNGNRLKLKPKEYELLACLARRRGQVLSREQLMRAVWGQDLPDSAQGRQSRTVDVHVHWIREKIEIDPSQPSRILTIRGKGYRFDG